MIVAVGLLAIQVYLVGLGASRVDSVGTVGGVLVAIAAAVTVGQIVAVIRLRNSSYEALSYPLAFFGVLVVGGLVSPLIFATI